MLKEEEIREGFEILDLQSEEKRQRILSKGASQKKPEHKTVYIFFDNITTVKKEEGLENAGLE